MEEDSDIIFMSNIRGRYRGKSVDETSQLLSLSSSHDDDSKNNTYYLDSFMNRHIIITNPSRRRRCLSPQLLEMNRSRISIMHLVSVFVLFTILIMISSACFGIPVTPKSFLSKGLIHRRRRHHHHPYRLADLLPNDLDAVSTTTVTSRERFMGALGVQLLCLGGWTRTSSSSSLWKPPPSRSLRHLTLKDRLAFITPSWKGGNLNYNYHNEEQDGIFTQGTDLLTQYRNEETTKITTLAQLADLLQDQVGLSAEYFADAGIQYALQAMLSWRIDSPSIDQELPILQAKNPLMIFVFSFGTTDSCQSPTICPQGPGSTNELLAATAVKTIQDHLMRHRLEQMNNNNYVSTSSTEVHVVAQWEVVTAIRQNYDEKIIISPSTNSTNKSEVTETRLSVTSVGTPGSYETTSDIFQLMLCEWEKHQRQQHGGRLQHDIILLAHPDHLRRVWWIAQSVLLQRKTNHYKLRAGMITNSKCDVPVDNIRILPALVPYSLQWPSQNSSETSIINLFQSLPPTVVHSFLDGKYNTTTTWNDPMYLGFFPDDNNPQMWTHYRDIWILYDHWAVLKGFVSGSIDPRVLSINK